MRERPPRIERQRREHREDRLVEVFVQTSAVFFAEVGVIEQTDAGAFERGTDIFAQAAVRFVGQSNDFRADRFEQCRSGHPAGCGVAYSRSGLSASARRRAP